MRVSVFPLLLAGAGLAQYAAAGPIRVVVVTSSPSIFTNVTLGDARPIPLVADATTAAAATMHGAGRHSGCARLKEKALMWSNKFRETFGLPPIEPNPPVEPIPLMPAPPVRISNESNPGENELRILPFMGTPPVIQPIRPVSMPASHHGIQILPIASPYRERMMMHHQMHHRGPFLHRAHHALMMLGAWEGRAVAFVLGCGIGVLLRMLWVMTIVVARAFRGQSSEDEDVQEVLVFEADAEHIMVPPPQYTDEKVALIATSEAEHEDKA